MAIRFLLDNNASPMTPLVIERVLLPKLTTAYADQMLKTIHFSLDAHPYYLSLRNKVLANDLKVGNELPDIALPLSGGFLTLWEMSNSTATFEKTFDTPVNLRELKGNYYPVWGETGLLLIPQAIGSQAVKVTVDYLYHMKDTEGEGEARFIEATLPASDLWQSGNAISYTLKISETHEIIFQTPKVESWGAPQSGGTIIIK